MSKIINSSEPKNTKVQLQMIKLIVHQQKIAIFGSFELFFCSFKLFLLIQTIFSFELFFCSWTIFFARHLDYFFLLILNYFSAHIELFFEYIKWAKKLFISLKNVIVWTIGRLNYYTWYHVQKFKRPIVHIVNSSNGSSSNY